MLLWRKRILHVAQEDMMKWSLHRAVFSKLKWYKVQKNGSKTEYVQKVVVVLGNEQNKSCIVNALSVIQYH